MTQPPPPSPTRQQAEIDLLAGGRAFLRAQTSGGRPTKLTEDLSARIVQYIRTGQYVETACAAVGLNKDTYYAWLRRAAAYREERRLGARKRQGEEIYLLFSDAVERGLAEAEMRDVNIIGAASASQWQAAAWRLERRHPQRWGRVERVQLSGPDGAPIATQDVPVDPLSRLDPSKLSDEQLSWLDELLEQARRDD